MSGRDIALDLAVDLHHLHKMKAAGGIIDEITEDAISCLKAAQSSTMYYEREEKTINQWAEVLKLHASTIRRLLYEGTHPATIIKRYTGRDQ